MESIIDRISELLRQHIGLDVASIGSSALEHSLKVRMKAIGVSHLDEYWYRLSEQEELQELIETIIVPETWFFRQQPVFEALADYAISEWLPSNIVGNLRVLSLPCATGEEAFSH
jgi:chemotaxis protein methyltransferase WspC